MVEKPYPQSRLGAAEFQVQLPRFARTPPNHSCTHHQNESGEDFQEYNSHARRNENQEAACQGAESRCHEQVRSLERLFVEGWKHRLHHLNPQGGPPN